ncbi:MAG TPA: sigma-70 family RNA polymerase sigma factor [Gemmata sp.]|nr:sigma-70 family RNA polymerase sigma factor [Gemmata sp.]
MRTATTPHTLARKLLRVALNPRERSDRELLAQFASNRDEDAFEELVRRHGRMVLSVARRVTGSQQDAEDAFQAAFLVLARRATHIKQPEQLANWLYGVAYRTALEARAARRRVLEHPVSAIPETAASITVDDSSDLRRVIDEELARLPEKYRAAVVMCDLEGLPRAEAASSLKIPEGTLSSRLAYARKILANRLTKRGINSTGCGIAALLAGEATGSALPRELVFRTARVATRIVSGGAVPSDLVSPSVSHLTEGVMKIMLANRLRLYVTAGVLACGLIALGAIGVAQQPYQQTVQPPPGTNPQSRTPYNLSSPVPLKEKDVPKIAAKGIEDEDVPYVTFPMQAVVRIENGKLVIRKRIEIREPATHQLGNQSVTTYYSGSAVFGQAINDASDIAVFDMKGNRLMPKVWKEKLKVDIHVLIGFDGKLPNPRELTLFKDDTLLLILPDRSALYSVPPPAGNYFTPTTSFVPITESVPRVSPTVEEYTPPSVDSPPRVPNSNYLPPQVSRPPVPSQNTPLPQPSSSTPRPASTQPIPVPQTTPTTKPATQPVPAAPTTNPPTSVPDELVPPGRETPENPSNR